MQTVTANQAKVNFGAFVDQVQREPVRVTRRDRVVGVMVSNDDFEAMRAFYTNRLQHTLNQTAQQAKSQGLTKAGLVGRADILISGDRDLLDLGQIEGVPIVSPAVAQARLKRIKL
jgi:prevent-host-death family protein